MDFTPNIFMVSVKRGNIFYFTNVSDMFDENFCFLNDTTSCT